MPNTCSVCQHPLVAEIDALLASGVRSQNAIARQFGIQPQTLRRHIKRRVAAVSAAGGPLSGTASAMSPLETFERAFDFPPMPHQRDYLTETRDLVFLKGRQIGASQGAAALAIHTARSIPGSDSVIVSATQRQSSEVAVRARLGLASLGEKLVQDSATTLRLTNGSRILSLPQSEKAVRGYSAVLLIMDEAAFIEEPTWVAASPMTSATGGRTVVQSTPGVPSGWFYELTKNPPPAWASMRVTSEEVRTVSREFLARKRAEMAPHLYRQEYLAEFASVGSVGRWFTAKDYDERINEDIEVVDLGITEEDV